AAIILMAAALAALPAWAQNTVPPTAVEAAKMPEFASRLAHAAKRVPPPKSSAFAPAKGHFRPLQSNDVYDNGPINGTTDAWTINFGFVVSDSLPIPAGGATVTGATFGMWLTEGDTLESAQLSVTSGENGGTSYFNQTVNFTQSGCSANQYDYDVCTEATSFNVALSAGTYWVNLQNAVTADGEPIYWDENSGPSSASESEVGTIPSESFTILGSSTTTTSTSTFSNYACPPPQTGFREVHDFGTLPPQDSSSGVALDRAGNLYATLPAEGTHGAGALYELAQRAGHWFYTTLYSFLGGSGGSDPGGVIVGPGGDLYGSASGGNQNCGTNGSSYCGLIYQASPGPTPCATALCSWNVTAIYQFSGNTDEWYGGVTAFDSAGNLYGISGPGAYGLGSVFELSPAQGGWTEKTLYDFMGGNGGGNPNSLLLGLDGNLYGAAGGGQYGQGVVFQLVPSGGAWTENVIYAFTGGSDGWGPYGLIQSPGGGLVGAGVCYELGEGGYCIDTMDEETGTIFGLSRSGGGWQFSNIYTYGLQGRNGCQNFGQFYFHGLAFDQAGNLYAAGGGFEVDVGGDYYWCGEVANVSQLCCGGGILIFGRADIFENLTSDASGNLYGTTDTCGFGSPMRTTGMVWQYLQSSP
ncbi:MAG: choice-of-anchor tandem repeat GloVer-containing protein, partial [Candidatus Korobacteraceae bacterium]